jgi:hypothetical protein
LLRLRHHNLGTLDAVGGVHPIAYPLPMPNHRLAIVETSKPRLNSLFSRNNSLILRIFSLLICVGNCARSRCRRAVSWYGIPPQTPEIAIFPVKFPVSREFALETGAISTASPARQSGIPRFCPQQCQKWPPMAGFCKLARGLQAPDLATCRAKSPIVSGGYLKYSRFSETATGDRVRSGTAWCSLQCNSPNSPPWPPVN